MNRLGRLRTSVPAVPLRAIATRAAVAYGLCVGAAPVVAAVGVTAYDVVKRRGRRRRPAQRPGTFEATVGASTLTIFTSGSDVFDDMIASIDAAQESVKLETYIWKADATGQRFLDAINRAAARGVQVWVSYDGFGNLVVPRRFYRQFHPEVRVYRLPAFARPFWRGLVRHSGFNHSKILVVDGRVGYVGGYNIGDEYACEWRDTHVKEEGPAVWGLDHSISQVWNSAHRGEERMQWIEPLSWEPVVTVSANLPLRLTYPIRTVYLNAIDRAQRHIYISTPYFIPDRQVLDALKDAAGRGVDVRVMIPKDSNHVVADWVSRGFYAEMAEAGITVVLYAAGMIHAKTATIDGEWSTVGTANIDRLSLSFNYETNLSVVDRDFAARMEEIFEADSAVSEVLCSPRWQDRHGLARVVETMLRPLRPLL
ncbi:phospholipase D-like domain-containing protein [Micrococcus sp.]|uniref:phospholipase D-like domain-containing protein n=1 Tax=Micrococcus sp. TaxID=1271 RepID=UPI002A910C6D|nr:phospholipase D-like domain-containing protein [Micrococcus sp.]MDY6055023.1 phospholipase D-like domain-containing protein [Micrococcus sp.]